MAAQRYPIDHVRASRGGPAPAPSFRGFPGNLPPPALDGLSTLTISPHTKEKLHAIARFCNAFSTALKKTAPTAYIDLFAGPGVLQLETSHDLVWGSPLLALQCPEPFKFLTYVEQNPERWAALCQRARRTACRGERVTVINGPAEGVLHEVLHHVPARSIAVTVVDPFRIEFSLAAVRTLAAGLQRLDLILLFAEGMDLRRNLSQVLAREGDHAGRYDAVFGGQEWRALVNLQEPPARNAGRLRDLYLHRLREVGFSRLGDPVTVKNTAGSQVYLLLYASRADLGVRLWNHCTRPDQMTFSFG
jgi:three-Cys-motif partner protein